MCLHFLESNERELANGSRRMNERASEKMYALACMVFALSRLNLCIVIVIVIPSLCYNSRFILFVFCGKKSKTSPVGYNKLKRNRNPY